MRTCLVVWLLSVAISTGFSAEPAKETRPSRLTAEQLDEVGEQALAFFKADSQKQESWRFDKKFDDWLAADEAAIRAAVWKSCKNVGNTALKADFDANKVTFDKHTSPYTVKKVGKKPQGGWPLFIAMHGGGNAPKSLNDSQWKIMQRYYRDQDSLTGYLYVALRAPNDTWNGFYDDYVPPLISNLIRQFLLFGEVDPDRVFIMGYSHGGYGAFFIGPKIPDRFAAIHASAAAPTAGTISPRSLRNTPFTFMIGEKDTAYGRRKLCEGFNETVAKLRDKDVDGYPVKMEFMKGFGHGGLPDRDKIKEMGKQVRNPVPKKLFWDLTDGHIKDFFWLSTARPVKGSVIEAQIQDNVVILTTKGVKTAELRLDGRLVDCTKSLKVTHNGETKTVSLKPSLAVLCRSIVLRGDPSLAWTCSVECATGKE